MRERRRWRWGALALLLAVVAAAAPRTGASSAPGDFVTRGSVGQVAVLRAEPGAQLVLVSPTGENVAGAIADESGSALWRDVAPGIGYYVTAGNEVGAPVTVSAADAAPDPALYASQPLADGFGYITTRDGTTLSAMVRLPGPPELGPYPTVVELSADAASNPDKPLPNTSLANALGYATVSVNVRGTGCSGGAYWPGETLHALDGYDVVETVAAQPWVLNARVGLVGYSASSLAVALTNPPHLAAIAPIAPVADEYRAVTHPGGIPAVRTGSDAARARAEQAQAFGQGWEQTISDAGGPVGGECAANQLLRHQNQDLAAAAAAEFADPATAAYATAGQVTVPVFTSGTWQDEQTGGAFGALWEQLVKARRSATNGSHNDALVTDVNGWYEFLEFYVAQRVPHMPDFTRSVLPVVAAEQLGAPGVRVGPDRFTAHASFAEALAAYEAEAPVRVTFSNGSEALTVDFAAWPPPQTQAASYYLQPDQRLGTSAPQIADDEARGATPYSADPAATPVDAAAAANDWRPLPVGNALSFDSDALASETVMAGSGSVDLWLRSSATDTDLEVTLSEVRADGQEMYVQSGWLRASHRTLDATRSTELRPWATHAAVDAAPLTPGEFTAVRVELFDFAHVFHAGSKIRVSIAAPGADRPYRTYDTVKGAAVNEIGHSLGRPSRVVLPVIPGVDAPDALPACPSLHGQPCRPAYGPAQPVGVAATAAHDDVTVAWQAPTLRPGTTLAGYRVHEAPGGAVVEVGAATTTAAFADLEDGAHSFTVEARYAEGGGSGRSTASNTIVTAPAPAPTPQPAPPAIAAVPQQVTEDPDGAFEANAVAFEDLDPNDPLYDLAVECNDGDMAACDELYAESDFGSDLEAFADTCGGTQPEGSGGYCSEGVEETRVVEFGSLDPNDPLYPLAVACNDGDMAACDELYTQSEVDSDLEAFADTCGNTQPAGTGGFCQGGEIEDEFETTGFETFDDGSLATTGTSSRNMGLTAALMLVIGGGFMLATRAPARDFAPIRAGRGKHHLP